MDSHAIQGWVMLVCNPVSGMGRGRERLRVVERLLREAGVPFRSELTGKRGDAVAISRRAVAAGCGVVVAIGGDGTLFEVVNGVMGPAGVETPNNVRTNPVAIGLVQAGRGSDFGRTVGVPSDIEAAARRLIGGRVQTIDLGHVAYQSFTGEPRARYFANAAGLGFDAQVTVRANNAPRALGGTIPYLSSLFTTLLSYRNKRIAVKIDGAEEWQARVNSIVVANGQYFGGGMRIAPEAQVSDGAFDVTVLGDLGKLDLVRNTPRVYDGSHLSHPKVSAYRGEHIAVTSPERLLLQADGEVLGTAPARFTVVPGVLRLIV